MFNKIITGGDIIKIKYIAYGSISILLIVGYFFLRTTVIPLGATGVNLRVSVMNGVSLRSNDDSFITDSEIIKIGYNERYVIAMIDSPSIFGEEVVFPVFFDSEDPKNENLELPSSGGTEAEDRKAFYIFAEENGIELFEIEEFLKLNGVRKLKA